MLDCLYYKGGKYVVRKVCPSAPRCLLHRRPQEQRDFNSGDGKASRRH